MVRSKRMRPVYWLLLMLSKQSETTWIRVSNQIKSLLHSPYYTEACNEWRGPSPRLSAWATQLRRNVAAVASRWRHCADLTGPGIEPHTSRTENVRLATELMAGTNKSMIVWNIALKSVLMFLYYLVFNQKRHLIKTFVNKFFHDFRKASKKRYRTIVWGTFAVAFFKDGHYFGSYTIFRKYAVVKTKIGEQMKKGSN